MGVYILEKLKLCVIFGGQSPEHDISRLSVTSILQHLNLEKYEIYIIGITKNGAWRLYTGPLEKITD
ncbi:MAG TPA: D-alanine--D-alanine ligase, partial [Candidatus Avimonoglobus intestinipullorum]|nr:D-alanine--D-alanine ligase [Candidatus Avimonoglobus intestinipullorum]